MASDWFVGVRVVGDPSRGSVSEVSMDQTVLQPVQSTAKVTALAGCLSARGRNTGVFMLRLRTLPTCHVARGKSLHPAALLPLPL